MESYSIRTFGYTASHYIHAPALLLAVGDAGLGGGLEGAGAGACARGTGALQGMHMLGVLLQQVVLKLVAVF